MFELISKFNKSEKFFIDIKKRLIYDDFEIEKLKVQNFRQLILKTFDSINRFNYELEEKYKTLEKKDKLLKKEVEFCIFYSKYKNYFFNKI